MNHVKYLVDHPRLNLAVIVCYMILIFVGSSVEADSIPDGAHETSTPLHVLEYAVLGFLLMPYVMRWPHPILLAVGLASLYGVSDEVHQMFVPGRDPSVIDVLADFIGSCAGAFVSWRLGRL